MALLPAVNQLFYLLEAEHSNNLFEFRSPIRPDHQRDFVDQIAFFKAIKRMCNHRLTRQEAGQLVQPHAATAPGGHDYRRNHERILCTSWLRTLPSTLPAAFSCTSFITAPI